MFNAIILQAAARAATQARNLGLLSSLSPGSPPTKDDKVGGYLAWISVIVLGFAILVICATKSQGSEAYAKLDHLQKMYSIKEPQLVVVRFNYASLANRPATFKVWKEGGQTRRGDFNKGVARFYAAPGKHKFEVNTMGFSRSIDMSIAKTGEPHYYNFGVEFFKESVRREKIEEKPNHLEKKKAHIEELKKKGLFHD